MCNLPSLSEFIEEYEGCCLPKSSYVVETEFSSLYVRLGPRYYGELDVWYRTLDIANVSARVEGAGAFARLITALREQHPTLSLYVENVLTERFAKGLVTHWGFVESESNMGCYWSIPDGAVVIPHSEVACPKLTTVLRNNNHGGPYG